MDATGLQALRQTERLLAEKLKECEKKLKVELHFKQSAAAIAKAQTDKKARRDAEIQLVRANENVEALSVRVLSILTEYRAVQERVRIAADREGSLPPVPPPRLEKIFTGTGNDSQRRTPEMHRRPVPVRSDSRSDAGSFSTTVSDDPYARTARSPIEDVASEQSPPSSPGKDTGMSRQFVLQAKELALKDEEVRTLTGLLRQTEQCIVDMQQRELQIKDEMDKQLAQLKETHEAEISDLVRQRDEINADRAALEEEHSRDVDMADRYQTRVTQLEHELVNREEQCKVNEDELAKSRTVLREFQHKAHLAERAWRDASFPQPSFDALESAAKSRAMLDDTERVLAQVQQRNSSLEGTVRHLSNLLETAHQDPDHRASSPQALQTIESVTARMAAVENALLTTKEQAQLKRKALKNALSSTQKELSAVTEAYETLRRSQQPVVRANTQPEDKLIAEMKRQWAETSNRQRQEYQNMIEELERNVSQIKMKLRTSQEKNEELQIELQKVTAASTEASRPSRSSSRSSPNAPKRERTTSQSSSTSVPTVYHDSDQDPGRAVVQLQERIADLETRNAELAQLQERIADLETKDAEFAHLQDRIAELEIRNTGLQKSNDDMEHMLRDYEEKVDRSSRKVQDVQGTVRMQKQKIQGLESELEALQAVHEELRQQRDSATAKVTSLTEERDAMEHEHISVKTERDEAEAELEHANDELEKAHAELARQRMLHTQVVAQSLQRQDQVVSLQKEIEALEAQIESLDAQWKVEKTAHAELITTVERAKENGEELQRQVVASNTEKDGALRTAEELRATIKDLTSQSKILFEQLEDARKHVGKLQERLGQSENAVAHLAVARKRLEQSSKDAEHQGQEVIKDLRSQVAGLTSTVASLEEHISHAINAEEAVKKEKDALQSHITSLTGTIDQLTQSIATLQAKSLKESDQLRAEIDALQSRLDGLAGSYLAMESDKNAALDRTVDLVVQVASLNRLVDELKKDKDKDNSQLGELSSAKERSAELEKTVRQMKEAYYELETENAHIIERTEGQIAGLIAKLAETENLVDSLQHANQLLREEHTERLLSAEQKYGQTDATLAELKAAYGSLSEEKAALLSKAKSDLSVLNAQLIKSRRAVQQLTDEMSALRDEHIAKQTDADKSLAELRAQSSEQSHSMAKLTSENDALEAKASALEGELERRASAEQYRERQLSELTSELSGLRTAKQDLMRKIHELEDLAAKREHQTTEARTRIADLEKLMDELAAHKEMSERESVAQAGQTSGLISHLKDEILRLQSQLAQETSTIETLQSELREIREAAEVAANTASTATQVSPSEASYNEEEFASLIQRNMTLSTELAEMQRVIQELNRRLRRESDENHELREKCQTLASEKEIVVEAHVPPSAEPMTAPQSPQKRWWG